MYPSSSTSAAAAASSAPAPAVDEAALEEDQDGRQGDVFARYASTALGDVGRIHPGDIVEAAALEGIDPPKAPSLEMLRGNPLYPLHESIDHGMIERGVLSRLQLESVVFAARRHQLILPTNQRAGFFIGDGTGVGKGRQLSGIILDSCCRGRRRHIWLSTSADLRVDAERDLRDCGCHASVIGSVQALDKGRAKGLWR